MSDPHPCENGSLDKMSLPRTPSAFHNSASPVRDWPDSDTDRDAEDYRAFVATCDSLGRLADSAEVAAFLASENDQSPFPDCYADEPMVDDGPLWEPTQEDLDWLLSQRAEVQDWPSTVEELDRQMAALQVALARG
jgi:hypothetical protein